MKYSEKSRYRNIPAFYFIKDKIKTLCFYKHRVFMVEATGVEPVSEK